MEQLSGMDAGFLYMETPTLHMHTIKVAVIEPSRVPGGYSFEKFREVLAENLHLLPPFRRRLVEAPLGLAHPVWIEDPDFDLDAHITRHRALAPGSPRELCQVVSDIAGRQLDRRRPLWEIAVVEGLEGGNVGFVCKMHHCVADGVAALELLLNVLRTDPEPAQVIPASSPWTPDPVPTRGEWLRMTLRSWSRRLVELPRLLGRTVFGLIAMIRHIRAHRIKGPVPFRTPVLSFNRSLSANRIFATASLSLLDMKVIKDRFGVTLNDVVLAVCSGALRRYLAARNELPKASLIVGVPFNTQLDRRGRLGGNRVGNIIATLRTDLEDPGARLRAIHQVMEDAKRRQAALGTDILESWAEFAPPRPYSFVMGLWSRFKLSDRVQPPFNMVVSSVPGPLLPLHIAGGRLITLQSVGPIVEGIGLNVTAWSYAGEMQFAALACPEQVPDIWDLVGYLPGALRELGRASGAADGANGAPDSVEDFRPATPGDAGAPAAGSPPGEPATGSVTTR